MECTDCSYNQDCTYLDEEIGELIEGTSCLLTGSLTPFFGHEPDCPLEDADA